MSPACTDPDLAALRRRLLAWYRTHGRDLPWRHTTDPWAILVSEVMLQQTRVASALPYFERFMARWPRPADLAAASLDELLRAWAGLGYYSRARRLHQTACLVAEGGGALPGDAVGLARLPGVGAYTAAAVASIAYGEPLAVVDGNVRRVLARLLALPGDLARGDGRRAVQRAADALLDPRRPADFNQAMMELGATCCLPARPRCDACPLAGACLGRASGEPERYPEPLPRPAPVQVRRVAAVVWRRGLLLLLRRHEPPNEGFLDLPSVDLPALAGGRRTGPRCPDDAPTAAGGAALLVAHLLRSHGLRLRLLRPLPVLRHAITRFRIHVQPHLGTLSSGRVRDPLLWRRPAGMGEPLTTATRRILARADREQTS